MAHLIGSSSRSCLRPHESTSLRGQAWTFRETSLDKNDGRRQNRAHSPLPRLRQAVKTFQELKLWNDMIFVDLPKHRRLVCSQCGSRNVRVKPIFPAAH